MKKYKKDNSSFEITNEEYQDLVEQIYEQTFIRSLENKIHPLAQLSDDIVDIVMWLKICTNVTEEKTSISILKSSADKIKQTVDEVLKKENTLERKK